MLQRNYLIKKWPGTTQIIADVEAIGYVYDKNCDHCICRFFNRDCLWHDNKYSIYYTGNNFNAANNFIVEKIMDNLEPVQK